MGFVKNFVFSLIILLINSRSSNQESYYSLEKITVKLAKYHIFLKFLAKKHCFGNKWRFTTFLELEFQKLEFLISFATVALLRWKLAII